MDQVSSGCVGKVNHADISCLAEKFRIGAAQCKNAFNIFWHEIPNTLCLFLFFNDSGGMLVVVGGHPVNIGSGYWLFLCHCQFAEVMRSRFVILRRLHGDKSLV